MMLIFVFFVDGMVLIDEGYIKENRKIIAHLLAAFRYGREDLDVLGLTFRKDLISQNFQVTFLFLLFYLTDQL